MIVTAPHGLPFTAGTHVDPARMELIMFMNGFSVRIPQGSEQNGYVLLKHETVYTLKLRNTRDVQCDAQVEIDGHLMGQWRIGPKDSVELEHPVNDDGRFTFYRIDSEEGHSSQLVRSDPNLGLIRVIFTPELVVSNYENEALRQILTVMGDQQRQRGILRQFPGPQPQRVYVGDNIPWNEQFIGGVTNDSITTGDEITWTCQSSGGVQSSGSYNLRGNPQVMFCANAGGTGLSGDSEQEYDLQDPLSSPDLEQQTVIQLRLIERTKHSGPRPLISANSTPYPPPVTTGPGKSIRKLNIQK